MLFALVVKTAVKTVLKPVVMWTPNMLCMLYALSARHRGIVAE
jgi:hypothetical protein